jgi:tetratricopeptide (TPR) repeat protein
MSKNSKVYFKSCQPSGFGRLSSVLRLLSSVLILLLATWAFQVMSSAWIRALAGRQADAHRVERAEPLYRLAARIDPQNWQAHRGLGDILYHRRYYELDPDRKRELALQERTEYATAYRINSKKEEVVYGLGRVELFLGNQQAGLDLLRQAADYKRFNDFYWRKLGIELRKAGFHEEALERFEYAQKLDRSNLTTRRNIEWLEKRVDRKQ